KKTVEDQTATVAKAQADVQSARSAVQSVWSELTENWSNQFLSRPVKGLTPEEFAWSAMEACGVVEQYRINADSEIEKTIPKASVQSDPAQLANRQFLVAQKCRELLAGAVA